MNMPQRLISTVFTLLVFFTHPVLAKPIVNPGEGTGIAFIHGTSDHRNDADGGYWSEAMISSVTKGLPNPDNHLVVHCDFRQYMWKQEAAGCVADQLINFIEDKQIDDLIVITHSDGGNVMRWILSNPSYDSRYPKIIDNIRWVNALAPSSLGTVLADDAIDGNIFEESLGWLLGYRTDSVQQQRIGDMAIYNENNLYGTHDRPDLPKNFYTIVGTAVNASPFSSANYCGGYSLNLGLKVTKLFLEDCADGFLNCSSQAGAGTVWFYDTEFTDDANTLNHNQSRSPCFGLDTLLRNDI